MKLLIKAMQRPPGSGWQPIPLGVHGGFRRPKSGGGYEYWYPEGTKLIQIVRRDPKTGKEREIIPGAPKPKPKLRLTPPPAERAETVVDAMTEKKSKGQRKSDNERALEIVRRAAEAGRGLTDEEAILVAKYTGKGGISGDLNQFYTRNDVALAMWDVIAAYQDQVDRVLEPSCGNGVFLGTAPKTAKVTGVELDPAAAAIAQALFGHKHEVETKAFEQFSIERMGKQQDFDAVIANPPYCVRTGVEKIPPHKQEFKSADQYFIDTSLDHLKDGGTCCLLIHPGVINNKSPGWQEFRRRLLARAEVLDAFRLPDDTFEHVHCGISADILVLRKRERRVGEALIEAGKLDEQEPTMSALGAWDQDFVDGKYFDTRQDRILGRALTADETGWRATVEGDIEKVPAAIRKLTEENLARRAKESGLGAVTFDALAELAKENEHVAEAIRRGDAAIALEDVPPALGNIKYVGRRRYMYIGSPPKWTPFESVEDVSQILENSGSDSLKEAHDISDDLAALMEARDLGDFYRARGLRRMVADRVKKWVEEYGIPASHRDLSALAKQAPKLFDFMACVNSDGELSDILSKDAAITLKAKDVDRSDLMSVVDYIARRNRGFVTIDDIQHNWEGWEDQSPDEVRRMLLDTGQFALVNGELQHMEDYLTGNLYEKLDALRGIEGEQYMAQRLAIQERLDTKRRSIDDIPLQIRCMGWMPLKWFSEFLNSPAGRLAVFNAKPREPGDPEVKLAYGKGIYTLVTVSTEPFTQRVWSDEEHRYIEREYPAGTVMKRTADGYDFLKYLNRLSLKKEKCEDVEQHIERTFNDWIKESHLRVELEELYNRTFNGEFRREYSGDPLGLEGIREGVVPHDFQNQAVRWAAETGRGILGQDVGLGKTFIAILLARLRRQDGTSRRPMVVVPKSVATNWAEEVETLFPGSRVLVIGEHRVRSGAAKKKAIAQAKEMGLQGDEFARFVEENSWATRSDSDVDRNRKLAEIKQNDYDLIICTKPAFDRIPLKEETVDRYEHDDYWYERAGQIDEIRSGSSTQDTADKRIEKLKATWSAQEMARKFKHADDLVFWEDLGIDTLMADEAHAYKNLYAARSRFGQNPKFLGGSGQSKQARKMQHMARWVRDSRPTNGVYFLTATPTKNSPLEVFNMLQHIAPEAFQEIGIRNSEEFIDRFCQLEDRLVLTPPGKGKKKEDDETQFADEFEGAGNLESATCVTGFTNLKELEQIMDRFMLLQTATDVGLKIPDSEESLHLVDMTDDQKVVYATLRDDAGSLDRDEDPGGMFRILDQMKKAAQDLELLDPEEYSGWYVNSPKYKACVEEAAKGARERGGQIIFCDHNASHERIKAMLIEQGLRPDEIGIINAQVAPDSDARQAIGNRFNRGEIKVVIGNTGTMGEGVNLQGKKHERGTTDIHHLDQPWDPGTMHQRNGRGVRQGNRAEQVKIHTYLSRGSFDGFRHSTLKGKERWLDKLRSGADNISNDMEGQGLDEAEMLAMLSDDPDAALEMVRAKKATAQGKWYAKMAQESVEDFYKLQRKQDRLRRLKGQGETAERMGIEVERMRRQLLRNELLPLELKEMIKGGDFAPVAVGTFMTGEGEAARLAAKTVTAGDVIADGRKKVIVESVDLSARKLRVRHWGQSHGFDVDIDDLTSGDYQPTKFKVEDELRDCLKEAQKRSWQAPLESVAHIAPAMLQAHRDVVADTMRAWYTNPDNESANLLARAENGQIEVVKGSDIASREIVMPFGPDRADLVKAVADGNSDAVRWSQWDNDVLRTVERMCGGSYYSRSLLSAGIIEDAQKLWEKRHKEGKAAA